MHCKHKWYKQTEVSKNCLSIFFCHHTFAYIPYYCDYLCFIVCAKMCDKRHIHSNSVLQYKYHSVAQKCLMFCISHPCVTIYIYKNISIDLCLKAVSTTTHVEIYRSDCPQNFKWCTTVNLEHSVTKRVLLCGYTELLFTGKLTDGRMEYGQAIGFSAIL